MKLGYYILTMLFFFSCSSTRIVDSWVNKEYPNYKTRKVLIVGITDNLTARKIFEEKLASEFKQKNINAIESYDVFETTFTSIKQTENDIQKEIKKLKKSGFDAILISAVKGVDQKTVYSADIYRKDYYKGRFGGYYYMYQNVYFDPDYYEKYNIYNIEASLYDLKGNNDKSLVWVASYNIVDPKTIEKSVKDYVKAIMSSLEKESIIPIN